MKKFEIDAKKTAKELVGFIARTVKGAGFNKVILGLSGGLDSTVVAYLSKKALGKNNVIAIILPLGKLSAQSLKDAKKIANILGIKTECINISSMIDVYFSMVKGADKIRRGNKMARERMAVLYDLSKKYKALVIGTSNKTERLLGYGTLYGDTACALNPVANLYKTQVRQLARHLGIPPFIVNKAPTADLWPGQIDEGELGYMYADIDRLLFFMADKKFTDRELLKRGFGKKIISDIRKRIKDNLFKSQPPAFPK